MKQKSRAFLLISWLVLRLRWSLIFMRRSFAAGREQGGGAKPGIIHFTRRHRQFPLDCWCFEGQSGAYLYAAESKTALQIYRLPEISSN